MTGRAVDIFTIGLLPLKTFYFFTDYDSYYIANPTLGIFNYKTAERNEEVLRQLNSQTGDMTGHQKFYNILSEFFFNDEKDNDGSLLVPLVDVIKMNERLFQLSMYFSKFAHTYHLHIPTKGNIALFPNSLKAARAALYGTIEAPQ